MENRSCGIEQAYNQGIINWKTSFVSSTCRLYNPVCSLGQELEVPVYKFVKEALIRRLEKTGI
jgi:hypothetical protein